MSPLAKNIMILFARAVSALHAGTAAYLVIPPIWKIPQLLPALLVGLVVFSGGKAFNHTTPWKEVFLSSYLAPVGFFLAVHLLIHSPGSWVAAVALGRPFLESVVSGTPPAVYLVCLGIACFSAERPKEPDLYR